jgi:hypothetical protein
MTDSETPKFSRQRRAVVISAMATGLCIFLADAAGLRTTVRESLAGKGVSPPVANVVYFFGGAICFAIVSLLVAMWLASREVADESRRSWWLRKRVIAPVACWVVLMYPASNLGYSYLAGRDALSPSAHIAASYVYAPLRALVFRRTGARPGFGWHQSAIHYAYQLGEQHSG